MSVKMNVLGLNKDRTSVYNNVIKQTANAAPAPAPKKQSSLISPMVTRIYNARPGCGSCGK